MSTPYRQSSHFRVRLDDCDRSRSISLGRLFAIADEVRFDLYDGLAAAGASSPARQAIRAERMRVHRAPRAREAITIEAFLGRLGRTSLDVEHRILAESGELLAELSATVVALGPEGPRPCDPGLAAHVHAPLGVEVPGPGELDASVAFLRTLDAWPSHENTGGHVARTRMIEWVIDAIRVGARKEAFEHVGANAPGGIATIALVYEKEAFSGDGIRIAVASAGSHAYDAALVRSGAPIMHARVTVAHA